MNEGKGDAIPGAGSLIWSRAYPGDEPAPTDRAEALRHLRDFHRWRRKLRWRWFGWRHLRIVVALLVLRPVITFLLSLRWTKRCGEAARKESGVPEWRQFLSQLWIGMRYAMDSREFYGCRLFRPERRRDAELYIPGLLNGEIHAGLFGWGGTPFDKEEFNERCRAAGLPVIPILATCPPHGDPVVHDPDAPAWQGDLFTKQSGGGTGNSQRLWRRTADGGYTDGSDHVESAEALLRHLCDDPRLVRTIFTKDPSPEIVQPRVRNHEIVQEVSSGALATARIIAAARTGGRPALVFIARLKLPTGDSIVDNMSQGNPAATVELTTGRLLKAKARGHDGLIRPIDGHPDTGHPIEGLVLPGWKRVLEICVRGHEVFPEVPSLGWDVAFTPDGPVLVEANIMWAGHQAALDMPLGLTPYPRWTVEWLEERLGRGVSPPG